MIECCVSSCPSNSQDGGVSFYRFPVIRSDSNRQSSIERRSAWIRVVGRKSIDYDLAVVCSRHFVSGRPSQLFEQDSTDWVPSLELNEEGEVPRRKEVVVEVAPPPVVVAVKSGAPTLPKLHVEESILGSLLLSQNTLPAAVPRKTSENQFEETIKTKTPKICRLCLGKEVRLTRPFQKDNGLDDTLLQKIYECTTVKITLKASYPASICAICDTKLNEYSRFREKCIENDELLRSILDGDDNTCQEEDDLAEDEPDEEAPEPVDAPGRTSIQPLDFHESNEIRDLQLQLYGSSDENTASQSEFIGSDDGIVAPLPKITNVTSNAPAAAADASTSKGPTVVPVGATSPAESEPSQSDKAATPPSKATISVKPLASLAATTTPESTTASESAATESSASATEADKGATAIGNVMADGRLECTICARPFRNSYTLRRHMNLHTEENLHICDYCGKKFNDRSNWKIHLRAHTGDNLLRCVICFKTFISPSTLKYHLRAHRKMKVFECRFCVDAVTSYEALSDHIAAKHADVRMEDYAKLTDEALSAGDFLKIEMEADETTLTVTVPRSTNADSEASLQLPRLTPAPSIANAAAISNQQKSKDSSGEVVKVKEEVLDPDDIEIKQEPMDVDTLGALALGVGHDQVHQQLSALIPPADEESPPVILFRCDYCMKIFKYLYELRVHMRLHNGAKLPDRAAVLEKTTKPPPAKKPRHPSIDEDIAELANAPLPEHQCDKCEKCFRTAELLRVHIETHKTDDDITLARSCKICLKTFKCELNLVSHMRKHHNFETPEQILQQEQHQQQQAEQEQPTTQAASLEEKPQSPDSSSNDDGNQSQGESMDGTSSTAEGGGSGISRKCEICALSFECSYKLEQHMMTHFKNNEAVAFVPSADRPYKCTECHKRFKRKDYLLIHIRTHTGERRHKCDMCSSAFVHPSNLITHRKLHSNERPFKCDLCPAAFKLFAGLKIHRKRCVLKYLQENSVTIG